MKFGEIFFFFKQSSIILIHFFFFTPNHWPVPLLTMGTRFLRLWRPDRTIFGNEMVWVTLPEVMIFAFIEHHMYKCQRHCTDSSSHIHELDNTVPNHRWKGQGSQRLRKMPISQSRPWPFCNSEPGRSDSKGSQFLLHAANWIHASQPGSPSRDQQKNS